MLFLTCMLLVAGIPERDPDGKPHLRSESVVVRFADTGEVVLRKNPDVVRPIASVTKLLSGLLFAAMNDDQTTVTIGEEDKDRLKWSRSRLYVGLSAPWEQLVHATLCASDNRAMYAAVRAKMPREQFVVAMNEKAKALGMNNSSFVDPAGVDPRNVSTALDLLSLVDAAANEPRLAQWTLSESITLATDKGELVLTNPDRIARSQNWECLVGKTGYTVEAGRNLVVRVRLEGRPVDMVFLGSREMQSVFGDAGRVRRWLLERLSGEGASMENIVRSR